MQSNEIWIFGANGRCGRAIAAELAEKGARLVLVGRSASALEKLARETGGEAKILVADSIEAMAREIARQSPAVVIHTVGPFMKTALPIARACPAGTHYLDVGNELPVMLELLAMHDEAVKAHRSIIPGVGFGVYATESVVVKLCDGRPPAARVRVDNIARVSGSEPAGPTVAASFLDGFAMGGRRYEKGRLIHARLGGNFQLLTLPDGSKVGTTGIPTGELESARRASGAPDVVAAFPLGGSSTGLGGRLVRAAMPVVSTVMRIRAIREFAKKRVAQMVSPPPTRAHSWAHARVEWADGSVREGWLKAGDGYDFLARTAAAIAMRLVNGDGEPGAFTPGGMFGSELAVEAGGEFIILPDQP